jgi:hypothetical protein
MHKMFVTERPELRYVELALTACLVLLKLHVLHGAWGQIQGFDAEPWLDVFRATHWFQPLPGAANMFNNYHPPLSYLICRWIYAIYPHELEDSQVLSTLAMIGAIFALRSTLRTIGILWTLAGLVMLYTAASIPLLVWMSIETSYDSLVFMWFTVALAISVKLFWKPTPGNWWRRAGYISGLALLAFTLAAGLATKFNALIALGLPLLVIGVRRRLRPALRDLCAAFVALVTGAALVAPLYYQRYYVPFRRMFPQPIEWLRETDLKTALTKRDADPWGFLRHVLRIPVESITGTQEPVTDSFIHSIWLQIWKRDAVLGPQEHLSLAVSDLYVRVFAIVVVSSTMFFCLRHRRLPAPWRDLGYVLLTVSVTYCLLLLYFGWKYPIWDWRVFKAKYMAPAVLWIAYCTVLPVVFRPRAGDRGLRSPVVRELLPIAVVILSLIPLLFTIINHVLPVY